jgi:hypothetical protein
LQAMGTWHRFLLHWDTSSGATAETNAYMLEVTKQRSDVYHLSMYHVYTGVRKRVSSSRVFVVYCFESPLYFCYFTVLLTKGETWIFSGIWRQWVQNFRVFNMYQTGIQLALYYVPWIT